MSRLWVEGLGIPAWDGSKVTCGRIEERGGAGGGTILKPYRYRTAVTVLSPFHMWEFGGTKHDVTPPKHGRRIASASFDSLPDLERGLLQLRSLHNLFNATYRASLHQSWNFCRRMGGGAVFTLKVTHGKFSHEVKVPAGSTIGKFLSELRDR